MSARNIARIVLFITGVTLAVSPLPSFAQNDVPQGKNAAAGSFPAGDATTSA